MGIEFLETEAERFLTTNQQLLNWCEVERQTRIGDNLLVLRKQPWRKKPSYDVLMAILIMVNRSTGIIEAKTKKLGVIDERRGFIPVGKTNDQEWGHAVFGVNEAVIWKVTRDR